MNLKIAAGFTCVSGDRAVLTALHSRFSFRDKQAESNVKRFMKSCMVREMSGQTGPGWEKWKAAKLIELRSKIIVYTGVLGDDWVVPTGLLTSLKTELMESGTPYEQTDLRTWDFPRKILGKPASLRPYQKEAMDAIILNRGGMLRLATATGKTRIAQEIIRHYGFKSLFLVPSRSILDQTVRAFRETFGKNNVGVFGGGKKDPKWITVATYQSIYSGNEDWSEYSIVIGDEIHHVGSDTFYTVMAEKLAHAAFKIGLSADETRLDGGTILVEAATGPPVYSYEAPQGIKEGYLAKPTFLIYEVFHTQGTYKTTAKDSHTGEEIIIDKDASPYDGNSFLLATKNWCIGNDLLMIKVAEMTNLFVESGDSVLVLVDEKEQGEKLLSRIPGAKFVIGGSKSNESTIREFNKGELKALIGTSVIGEGTDCVATNVLINLMGGTRPKQANGRALRNNPDPETGIPRKPTCLIIDFDFPNNDMLHRHSEMREEVHQTCGAVHRERLF